MYFKIFSYLIYRKIPNISFFYSIQKKSLCLRCFPKSCHTNLNAAMNYETRLSKRSQVEPFFFQLKCNWFLIRVFFWPILWLLKFCNFLSIFKAYYFTFFFLISLIMIAFCCPYVRITKYYHV